jgi:hypothetical protein
MDTFIRQQNVEHYTKLLSTEKDEVQRTQILALLAEERLKQKDAGDPPEE